MATLTSSGWIPGETVSAAARSQTPGASAGATIATAVADSGGRAAFTGLPSLTDLQISGGTSLRVVRGRSDAAAAAVSSRPERWATMIGFDAWNGDDPATLGGQLDGAIFHSPSSAEPDDTGRRSFRATRATNYDPVYFNFGYADDSALTTTRVVTATASAAGFTAKYNAVTNNGGGVGASLDMGKVGYGAWWAGQVIPKLLAQSLPHAWGVFADDINIYDARLPQNNVAAPTGVPDGYASTAAYAAAIKVQLLAAKTAISAAGFKMAGNVSQLYDWNIGVTGPADTLAGLLDYTFVEFAGMFANGGAIDPTGFPRLIAAAKAGAVIAQTFGADRPKALFNDFVARIIGAKAAILSPNNSYLGPVLWQPDVFLADYGAPIADAVQSGSHLWRSFAGGVTLHVNAATFDVSTSAGPLDPSTLTVVAGQVASPAVPASTVTLTNGFGRAAAVHVNGGTITVIAVDGQTLGVTSGLVMVPAGKTIAITYSVAPTWKWTLL